MIIKAKIGFSGTITMMQGEERDVEQDVAKDLIGAGFAEEIKKKATTKKAVTKDVSATV